MKTWQYHQLYITHLYMMSLRYPDPMTAFNVCALTFSSRFSSYVLPGNWTWTFVYTMIVFHALFELNNSHFEYLIMYQLYITHIVFRGHNSMPTSVFLRWKLFFWYIRLNNNYSGVTHLRKHSLVEATSSENIMYRATKFVSFHGL